MELFDSQLPETPDLRVYKNFRHLAMKRVRGSVMQLTEFNNWEEVVAEYGDDVSETALARFICK